MNIILLTKEFDEETRQKITHLAPNFRVKQLENLLPSDYSNVEIMYGWPKNGLEILNSHNSQLHWVQTISAGVDSLPLDKLKERNILLSNGSGIHAIPIAESVLAMLLAQTRGIQTAIKNQVKSNWQPVKMLDELYGKKMIIIGTGHIGQRLAQISQHMGMEVTGVNRSGRLLPSFTKIYTQDNFISHLKNFDIIVNILPLTNETHHFYNQDFFDATKPEAIFVNVGRGPSVDEQALYEALVKGKIKFAALDVTSTEPLPKNHPLWQLENVLLTPHISGMTTHYNKRLNDIFEHNLTQYLTDQTLAKNKVNLTLGY